MDPHATSRISHKEVIESRIASTQELEDLIAQNQADVAERIDREPDQNVKLGMNAKTKPLNRPKESKTKDVEKTEKGIFTRKETDDLDNQAGGFSQREGNKEYNLAPSALSKLAQRLGDAITPDTNPDDLVRMIRNELTEGKKLPDVSQVDRTFDFLLEVTQAKMATSTGLEAVFLEKLYQNIATTKVKHYETFKAEIEAAHNIIGAANVLVTENRSTGEALDHLREMINNPQDVHTKHKYYKNKSYDHKMLSAEFKLLFNYMGSLVKQRLENPHLKQLLEEIKVLQSILGVYRQGKREHSSMLVHLDKSLGLFDKGQN